MGEYVIVDFCGQCGVLLPETESLAAEPECTNCGADISDVSSRIQGSFTAYDAARLYAAE